MRKSLHLAQLTIHNNREGTEIDRGTKHRLIKSDSENKQYMAFHSMT
jgi:hypothetical protein